MIQTMLIEFVAFWKCLLTKDTTSIQFHIQIMFRKKMIDQFIECEQSSSVWTFSTGEFLLKIRVDSISDLFSFEKKNFFDYFLCMCRQTILTG